MENENPVYVKLEYFESLESKRDLLSAEKSFLNMLKIIRRYNLLKIEEIKIRTQLRKIIKEVNLLVPKTKASFPTISNIPEMANREEKEIDVTSNRFDNDIESQLREIQGKLDSLGNL